MILDAVSGGVRRAGRGVRQGAAVVVRTARADPFAFVLGATAAIVSLVTVAWPLAAAHYPPLTDLPFHAANTSIFRRYFDSSFHFREQFTFKPLESPYLTIYLLGAFLELFLPPVLAMKVVAATMLLLLPAGLAVLFAGMKRSPLFGLLGLVFAWSEFTAWGFLNSMGALGLCAATIGVALFVLDRPTRRGQVLLAVLLVVTFFTHVFRYPFTAAGVLLAALLLYPATGRLTPVLLPQIPAALLCLIWSRIRPAEQGSLDFKQMPVAWERMKEIPDQTFHVWNGPEEQHLAGQMGLVVLGVLAISFAAFLIEKRWKWADVRTCWWAVGTTLLPAVLVVTFLFAFLVLPMRVGLWWMVYPREATSAGYFALALMPALPRARALRVLALAAVCAVALRHAAFTARGFEKFEVDSADFRRIAARLPQAPKLTYLLFDMGGADRTMTPYMHLPAWIQAEKGGWLSFHFAQMRFYPVRYRDGSPSVPPLMPMGFEWRPTWFEMKKTGAFFDYFLIRQRQKPDAVLASDRSVRRIAHVGMWWLYKRDGAQ